MTKRYGKEYCEGLRLTLLMIALSPILSCGMPLGDTGDPDPTTTASTASAPAPSPASDGPHYTVHQGELLSSSSFTIQSDVPRRGGGDAGRTSKIAYEHTPGTQKRRLSFVVTDASGKRDEYVMLLGPRREASRHAARQARDGNSHRQVIRAVEAQMATLLSYDSDVPSGDDAPDQKIEVGFSRSIPMMYLWGERELISDPSMLPERCLPMTVDCARRALACAGTFSYHSRACEEAVESCDLAWRTVVQCQQDAAWGEDPSAATKD
jgi:hypothetical protein